MLALSTRYGITQIDTSDPVGYPLGKARNVATIGDGTGTPFEKDLVNDILGLQQALIAKAGITPSGVPDKVGACQQVDAIEWIAAMSRCEFDAKKLGAKGDSSTDDGPKLAAAEAALVAAFGGGVLFLPPGGYKLTGTFTKDVRVTWRAKPGTVNIFLDHATQGLLNLSGATATAELKFIGINFEGSQTNDGTVLATPAGNTTPVRFIECGINVALGFLTGPLLFAQGSGSITLERCNFREVGTTLPALRAVGTLAILGGDQTMAPAAAAELIQAGAGGLRLEGVTFRQTSTGAGGNVFILPFGVCHIKNNKFVVDDSAAALGTYAIASKASAEAHIEGNSWGKAVPYLWVETFGAGSKAEFLSLTQTLSGFSLDVGHIYESVYIECTNLNAPTINVREPVAAGQEFELWVKNTHGSGSWSSAVSLAPAGSVGVVADGTASPNLANNRSVIVRFRARRDPAGALHWVQVAPWTQLN